LSPPGLRISDGPLALVARFGLAGLVNTAIGFSVIAALDLGLRIDPHLANAAGYAVGVASGFLLTRDFVFQDKSRRVATAPRYLALVVTAFALNQLVLTLAGQALGKAELGRLAAQLVAMSTYTITVFAGCKLWVFRASGAEPG